MTGGGQDGVAMGTQEAPPGRAFAGGALTLLAITLELLGSILGDAPTTRYPGRLVTLPFLVFAVGIALGASWATWH